MAAGKKLIAEVASILGTEGKTPKMIRRALMDAGWLCSPRAVRYALQALVDRGEARRHNPAAQFLVDGKWVSLTEGGTSITYLAVPRVEAAE